MTDIEKLEPIGPTELLLYNALCKLGKGTPRDVFDFLVAAMSVSPQSQENVPSIHTVMTLLQRLASKRYLSVKRVTPPIPNTYTPKYPWEQVFRRALRRRLEPFLLDREDYELMLEFLFGLPQSLLARVATDEAAQAQTQRTLYQAIQRSNRHGDPFEQRWPEAKFPGLEELRQALGRILQNAT